mmetsp:Transcript_118607/g.347440  ORF Transcript_118607/g.347440 Transcript_118607/m.347440 type:complete len:219 (-) Transcript_118607:70-726(-)
MLGLHDRLEQRRPFHLALLPPPGRISRLRGGRGRDLQCPGGAEPLVHARLWRQLIRGVLLELGLRHVAMNLQLLVQVALHIAFGHQPRVGAQGPGLRDHQGQWPHSTLGLIAHEVKEGRSQALLHLPGDEGPRELPKPTGVIHHEGHGDCCMTPCEERQQLGPVRGAEEPAAIPQQVLVGVVPVVVAELRQPRGDMYADLGWPASHKGVHEGQVDVLQ